MVGSGRDDVHALPLCRAPRWCITGTPLSRGLEDLYGLFFFLHARPWADAYWWRDALEKPYVEAQPGGAPPPCCLPLLHIAALCCIHVARRCLHTQSLS